MKINMHVNALKFVPRIAQLTQKTNQFNLATKRYTETDIEEFIRSTESRVICFEVSDKFSDNGIVGVAIILLHDQHAEIDTFLMSCRVIGRNVEFAVFNWIVKYLKRLNVQTVLSTYCETLKNGQVKDFYEGIGFLLTEVSEKTKMYKADINSLKTNNLNYLEVTGGRAAD
jgi:FkbH-like protein